MAHACQRIRYARESRRRYAPSSMVRPLHFAKLLVVLGVAALDLPARGAEAGGDEAFRFHVPEGFVDARSPHGRALDPEWPDRFCTEEGVAACAFSGEREEDGSRAFAYAKLVPGSQPVVDTLLARLARSLESSARGEGARVEVVERSTDSIRGHAAGRILARVSAGGTTTMRWMWVVATPEALAMLTYVAPEATFDRWRPAFEASALRTEGVVDGEPLMQRALAKGHGAKNAKVVLWMLVVALVLKVVLQATSRRRKHAPDRDGHP